jgi:hypothetical protein
MIISPHLKIEPGLTLMSGHSTRNGVPQLSNQPCQNTKNSHVKIPKTTVVTTIQSSWPHFARLAILTTSLPLALIYDTCQTTITIGSLAT